MRHSLTSAGTPEGARKWRESRRLTTRGSAADACGTHRASDAGAAAAMAGRPGAETAEGADSEIQPEAPREGSHPQVEAVPTPLLVRGVPQHRLPRADAQPHPRPAVAPATPAGA